MSFFFSPLTLLLVIGNVFGVAMLLPQGIRLAKTKSLAGVSPRWIGLGFAINAGWLTYASLAGLPWLLPVSTGALVLYTWMIVSLVRIPEAKAREALATAAVLLAALTAIALVGGIAALGLFGLGFLYTVQFAPAAWQSATSSDLSGIAPMTWVMALVEAVIWMIYGLSTRDAGLIIGGTGASIMAVIVLVNIYRAQPSASSRTRRHAPVLR